MNKTVKSHFAEGEYMKPGCRFLKVSTESAMLTGSGGSNREDLGNLDDGPSWDDDGTN